MKRSALSLSLAMPLAALLAVGGWSPQGPDKAGKAKPDLAAVVGVVDFIKIFEAYPKAIKEQQRLEELDKSHKGQIEARAAEMDELQLQIAKLQRNTRERAELELRLGSGQKYLEGMTRIYEVEWQREYAKFLVNSYADIEQAIQKVAKEKGLKLVLRQRKESGAKAIVDRMQAYQQRNVWYAAEELDLTPAVIKVLQVLPAKPVDGK